MSWKLESCKVVNHTPNLASTFATMPGVPNDRPIRPGIIEYIGTQIAEGKFREAEYASVYCKETDTTYRVNGKHTSTVFSTLNGSFPRAGKAIVKEYSADFLRDCAELYSTFDYSKGSRNQSDINAAFAATRKDLADLPRALVNLAVTGMAYAQWEGTYHQRTHNERAALAIENAPFVLWLDRIFDGWKKDSRFMRRGSVAAAMFLTFNRNQKAASTFWTEVRDGSNSDSKNASRVLQRYLLTTVIQSQRANTGMQNDTMHGMFVRSLHAWNAWRINESTALRYYADAPTPAVK